MGQKANENLVVNQGGKAPQTKIHQGRNKGRSKQKEARIWGFATMLRFKNKQKKKKGKGGRERACRLHLYFSTHLQNRRLQIYMKTFLKSLQQIPKIMLHN